MYTHTHRERKKWRLTHTFRTTSAYNLGKNQPNCRSAGAYPLLVPITCRHRSSSNPNSYYFPVADALHYRQEVYNTTPRACYLYRNSNEPGASLIHQNFNAQTCQRRVLDTVHDCCDNPGRFTDSEAS